MAADGVVPTGLPRFAVRKSEHCLRRTQRRLQRRAVRNGIRVPAQTLQYAQYVIVFTTLPSGGGERGGSPPVVPRALADRTGLPALNRLLKKGQGLSS